MHVVLKILPGWDNSYIDRHAHTEIPSAFVSPADGPVQPGNIAVWYTSRTKGAAMLHRQIPACCLAPVIPTSRNKQCVVLRGPRAGEVLTVSQAKKGSPVLKIEGGLEINASDVCLVICPK